MENVKVEQIITDKEEYILERGKYLNFVLSFIPEEAKNVKYSLSSDNSDVVSIENLKIYGKDIGSASVTITVNNKDENITKKIDIKVIENENNEEDGNIKLVTPFKVDEERKIITGIELGTTLESVKDKVSLSKEEYSIKFLDKDGNEIADGKTAVGTDSKITIVDGENTLDTYSIVMYGDISGDGIIDSLDILQLRKYLLEKLKLEGARNIAANTSKDEENVVDSLDILVLRRHLVGAKYISQ